MCACLFFAFVFVWGFLVVCLLLLFFGFFINLQIFIADIIFLYLLISGIRYVNIPAPKFKCTYIPYCHFLKKNNFLIYLYTSNVFFYVGITYVYFMYVFNRCIIVV